MTPEEFDVSSENNPGDLESADHRWVSRRSRWEVARFMGRAVLFAGCVTNARTERAPASRPYPFGDGRAAQRAAVALARLLEVGVKP